MFFGDGNGIIRGPGIGYEYDLIIFEGLFLYVTDGSVDESGTVEHRYNDA